MARGMPAGTAASACQWSRLWYGSGWIGGMWVQVGLGMWAQVGLGKWGWMGLSSDASDACNGAGLARSQALAGERDLVSISLCWLQGVECVWGGREYQGGQEWRARTGLCSLSVPDMLTCTQGY
jgi:hypothetical protein